MAAHPGEPPPRARASLFAGFCAVLGTKREENARNRVPHRDQDEQHDGRRDQERQANRNTGKERGHEEIVLAGAADGNGA